jgi:hypothetical protein
MCSALLIIIITVWVSNCEYDSGLVVNVIASPGTTFWYFSCLLFWIIKIQNFGKKLHPLGFNHKMLQAIRHSNKETVVSKTKHY